MLQNFDISSKVVYTSTYLQTFCVIHLLCFVIIFRVDWGMVGVGQGFNHSAKNIC